MSVQPSSEITRNIDTHAKPMLSNDTEPWNLVVKNEMKWLNSLDNLKRVLMHDSAFIVVSEPYRFT
jgi:hypothetical protein